MNNDLLRFVMNKLRLLGAVCTAIVICSNAAMATSFTPLGFLTGSVHILDSRAFGVSADGSVVIGHSSSASGVEAFRWTRQGGMIGLGDLAGGDFTSYAHGASGDGSVVVGTSASASGDEAFRWTSEDGMVGLGDFPGGWFFSDAYDVSADGSVVVGVSNSASGQEAFRWTSDGGMVGLGDLAGGDFSSVATSVSADGSVVVGKSFSGMGQEAFRWTSDGGMVGLGDLAGGSFHSYAYDVSADGSVVVGVSNSASGQEAFRWTSDGGMVGLGDLPGGDFGSQALGVSSDGAVVVGWSYLASGDEAFQWTSEYGMQTVASILTAAGVDITGWELRWALDISADGNTIVGYGINPDGYYEAWIADLNDAPLPTASFTPLGGLPGGDYLSQARGVSADGSVVVGTSYHDNYPEFQRQAVRWTREGGMVVLGDLDYHESSFANGVSADGSVIAGSLVYSEDSGEAFRWTSEYGIVGLGYLGDGWQSSANGVSTDGLVIVGGAQYFFFDDITEYVNTYEAFRWTSEDGMVSLGILPGGDYSVAHGVSAEGSVVAGYSGSASGREAFRWTNEDGMVGLGDLPGGAFYSQALGVSADGSVVVGYSKSDLGEEAFRWTNEDGMVGLGDLPGGAFYSQALGVSADGSVVVGYSKSDLGEEAFRWTSEYGMQSVATILASAGIDLTGWTLTSATGVSADGYAIVGYGGNPDGFTEAWIAVLSDVPLPTTPVDISGTIKATNDADICAMVLASGQYMFSCNPMGMFSLTDLPRESNGTVKRQIYADGFFPKVDILHDSVDEAVVMTRSGTCPSYNTPYDPSFVPGSAGKWINIAGKVLLQDSQTPICAMVLANGQYMFSCDGTGSYLLIIPLDNNGQYKLQVYADGFSPSIRTFDEYKTTNIVRMARATECQ